MKDDEIATKLMPAPVREWKWLYPALYQINTRVYLTELSGSLHRPATLDDIPDAELNQLAEMGFDWVWLLSVWRTGPAGQRCSRSNREWRREFMETLPDLREEDIAGSGFAIRSYVVPPGLGGETALARLRDRLRRLGLRLMLDFVPNHTALDHRWVEDHPEYYIPGTEADLTRAPQDYARIRRAGGDRLLAHGRDPYFPAWPDTLQLNYSSSATQAAMIGELQKISAQCDGVRCDMAMLVLPDVFERTWGLPATPFWPRAIERIRAQSPGFCFMAEVYWDLEWIMLQQGFDYAYDKRLYDRLRAGQARPVCAHLRAGLDYQRKLARFLENHDEPRAAATFLPAMHEAAAVITYLSPGLRFFHQGQLEGRKKRVSPHLIRAPAEPVDDTMRRFYDDLLSVLRCLAQGEWRLLDCVPAWDGNWTWDCCIAWCWQGSSGQRTVIAVNYAGNQSQCYIRLPWPDLAGRAVRLGDLLGSANYDRDGNNLISPGLYVDLPPWGRHAFAISTLS
jgi:Alpha amylase, catalytic domain